jgi:predicted RNA binding protein YcfA (HicA-like mRNA interferase family)
MPALPGEVDRRRFFRAMGLLGWHVVSIRGSNYKLVHVDRGTLVVVAAHHTIRRTALAKTLRMAGVEIEQFLDAL